MPYLSLEDDLSGNGSPIDLEMAQLGCLAQRLACELLTNNHSHYLLAVDPPVFLGRPYQVIPFRSSQNAHTMFPPEDKPPPHFTTTIEPRHYTRALVGIVKRAFMPQNIGSLGAVANTEKLKLRHHAFSESMRKFHDYHWKVLGEAIALEKLYHDHYNNATMNMPPPKKRRKRSSEPKKMAIWAAYAEAVAMLFIFKYANEVFPRLESWR